VHPSVLPQVLDNAAACGRPAPRAACRRRRHRRGRGSGEHRTWSILFCTVPETDGQRVGLLGLEQKVKGATLKTLRRSPWLIGAATTGLLLTAAGLARADAQPAPAASLGTLEYGTNLFYPQGCQHNGSTVVCTFAFVHQAETQTIRAGGGGSQLTGIQFIDDAHVPHKPNNAYFVDRYGARQHVLTMNRADQGTMMVEFPLVDPSGQLQLGTQVLAGIPVTAVGGAATPAATNALPTGNAAAAPLRTAALPATTATPAAAAPAAAAPGAAAAPTATPIAPTTAAGATVQSNCNTPELAKMPGCKLNTKIHQAEVSTTNTATSIAAPISAVGDAAKQITGLFGSFAPKKPEAAPAAPAQPPAPAPTQTQ
jgi:hypothetical protein